MFFENINWIVVVIAAIAGMGVSYVWHSPWAFMGLWMKSKPWPTELLVAKKGTRSMWFQYGFMFASTLALAIVIAGLFNSLVVLGLGGIFLVALTVWIGFSVHVKSGEYLFGGDSLTYFLLALGHELAVVLVISLIIGIFG